MSAGAGAAAAGSVMSRAEVRGSAQTCCRKKDTHISYPYNACPQQSFWRTYAEPGLWNGRVSVRRSVRPSVCLFHRSTAAAACGVFAAERPAGRMHQSIIAGAGSACQLSIDISCRRRRSAANAGSVMLRAEDRGSTRTCFELDSRNTKGEMTSQNIWSRYDRQFVGII